MRLKCGVSFGSRRCWWPTLIPLRSTCTCAQLLWVRAADGTQLPLPKEQEPPPPQHPSRLQVTWNPQNLTNEYVMSLTVRQLQGNSWSGAPTGTGWANGTLALLLPLPSLSPWELSQTRTLGGVLLPPKDFLAQMPTVFWRKSSPVQSALLNSHAMSEYPCLRASGWVDVSSY